MNLSLIIWTICLVGLEAKVLIDCHHECADPFSSKTRVGLRNKTLPGGATDSEPEELLQLLIIRR